MIDLDHHHMPDPVGNALARLLERIAELEQYLAQAGTPTPKACRTCDPDDCIEPTFVTPFMHRPTDGDKSK